LMKRNLFVYIFKLMQVSCYSQVITWFYEYLQRFQNPTIDSMHFNEVQIYRLLFKKRKY
jgi:hypothetical protein